MLLGVSLHELESELLKGAYLGDYKEAVMGVIKGDSRV